jgi:hypothetical protein
MRIGQKIAHLEYELRHLRHVLGEALERIEQLERSTNSFGVPSLLPEGARKCIDFPADCGWPVRKPCPTGFVELDDDL